jgi:3-methyladenine DNA glycosylase AlkD
MHPESLAVLKHLNSLENKANQDGMKRFAVGNNNTLGINVPVLRAMAKDIKKLGDRHQIAADLWATGIHEAMLLAAFTDDPKHVNKEQMDAWTERIASWDLCDQLCANLYYKTPFYLEKAFAYSYREEEFVKRTGFVLMLMYVQHNKIKDPATITRFLTRIEEEAHDERNFVKKAMNWLLRTIGKRNQTLYPMAIACCERLIVQNTPSSRWIARDALRELQAKHAAGSIRV